MAGSKANIYKKFYYVFSEITNQCQNDRKDAIPVDTGGKLNVHKTFRSCPGRLLNVLCTFNLHLVSAG